MLHAHPQGIVAFDRIFTSMEALKVEFPHLIRADLYNWMGYQFYWHTEEEGQLALLGTSLEILKPKEICRFLVPESWNGCGYAAFAWNGDDKGNLVHGILLLMFYLASDDPNRLEAIAKDDSQVGAFLAALQLGGDNLVRFHITAEKRFENLE